MTEAASPGKLGVLGGMGPRATADFFLKLVAATEATTDQDHVATVIRSVPQIPDRSAAILGDAPSPLPALFEGVRELVTAGATAIAIPCNTAHFWYRELAGISPVPIFHIADAVATRLEAPARLGPVGLMATAGTVLGRIYQRRLETERGYRILVPDAADQEKLVSPGIVAVKAGHLERGTDLLIEAARRLAATGATSTIMACTEIPVVLGPTSDVGMTLLDPTDALADHCVTWWDETRATGVRAPAPDLHLSDTRAWET